MSIDLKTLTQKIERLCARCDLLAREVSRLKKENHKLREKNENAKAHLIALLRKLTKRK